MIYYRALRLIKRHQIQSLTVNIFDTILLNDYWPSSLRLRDLSLQQLPYFQTAISPDITLHELFATRLYAQQLLAENCQLDLWLTKTSELLLTKYQVTLERDRHFDLIATLIRTELEFTLANCHPNHPLIAELTSLKQTIPDLKIHFTSQSYFTVNQLNIFFQVFQIPCFDGIITPHDAKSLPACLHIDDHRNRNSHIHTPHTNIHLNNSHHHVHKDRTESQSHYLHYHPIRFRGLRTLIGHTALSAMQFSARHQLQQLLAEAPQLLQIYCQPHLSRATVFRAFVWMLAIFDSPRWDASGLLRLLIHTYDIKSRSELYNLCFTQDYIYSNLAIDSFPEFTFYQVFLKEITAANPTYTKNLRDAYATAIHALPQSDEPFVFIANTDDGTAELFHQFARLHSISTPFYKFILHPHNIFPKNPCDYPLTLL